MEATTVMKAPTEMPIEASNAKSEVELKKSNKADKASKTTEKVETPKKVEPMAKMPIPVEELSNRRKKDKMSAEELMELSIDTQKARELHKKYGSKSAAIRELASIGLTRSRIAAALDIKYQFANNVLGRPLKREL